MLRLHYERLKRNLKQREVADLAKFNQSHLSLIELGRLQPTDEQLDRLSRFYGITPASVLLTPVKVVLDDVSEVVAP